MDNQLLILFNWSVVGDDRYIYRPRDVRFARHQAPRCHDSEQEPVHLKIERGYWGSLCVCLLVARPQLFVCHSRHHPKRVHQLLSIEVLHYASALPFSRNCGVAPIGFPCWKPQFGEDVKRVRDLVDRCRCICPFRRCPVFDLYWDPVRLRWVFLYF